MYGDYGEINNGSLESLANEIIIHIAISRLEGQLEVYNYWAIIYHHTEKSHEILEAETKLNKIKEKIR